MFASDCEKVKTFGGEFIGNFVIGVSTMLVALGVSFYFCWNICVLLILCLPLIVTGAWKDQADAEELFFGSQTNTNVILSKDSALMSESCVNWMTTQSLTGERLLVSKYEG